MRKGISARHFFLLICSFLLLGFVTAAPHPAYADPAATAPQPDADSACLNAEQSGSQAAFAAASTDLTSPLGNGPPNTRAAACLDTLEGIYDTVSSLFASKFDPTGVIATLISTIINAAVNKIIDYACSLIQQAVSFAYDTAMNLLTTLTCIPLPNWSGPGTFNIGSPPAAHCNGWSAFGAGNADLAGISITIPPMTAFRFRN